MNNIKVSVIIPVYNNEPFLRECLDSIINQTLREIEILCVDDGSTDNSLSVLREYENLDSRIKVFSQINSGAGIARNTGLINAKGEYISFIDSDDWLRLDALELLYNNAKFNDSDLVLFNGIGYYPNRTRERIYFPNQEINGCFNWKDKKNMVMNHFLIVCTKLHRRDLIENNDICFKDFPVNNDISFHIESMLVSDKISYVPEILYYYRRDEEVSLQSSVAKSRKGFIIFKVFDTVHNILMKYNLFNEFEFEFLKFKIGESRVRINQLHDEFKDEFFKLLKINFQEINVSFDVLKRLNLDYYSFYMHVLNSSTYEEFNNFNSKSISFEDNFNFLNLGVENEILSQFYKDILISNNILKAIDLIKKI